MSWTPLACEHICVILKPMRSVAGDLRRESLQRLALLTAEERVALALRLGEEDVALYCSVHGTSEQEAGAMLARARAAGRVPSVANER
jgi:hypothetical protein